MDVLFDDVRLVVTGQEHPLQLLEPHVPGLGLRAVADNPQSQRVGRGLGDVTRVGGGRQQIFVAVTWLPMFR